MADLGMIGFGRIETDRARCLRRAGVSLFAFNPGIEWLASGQGWHAVLVPGPGKERER